MTHLLLVGNPNCGKTTLFNALTGSNQRIGNWPGVTVEKKTGTFVREQQHVEITDLPGIYNLLAHAEGTSQDEQIAAQAVGKMDFDCIINVIDACHLERHLYLTSQLLELGKPMIVALNMMDIAKQRGISIDLDTLAKQLGCPVMPIQAHKKIGIDALMQFFANENLDSAVVASRLHSISPLELSLPPLVQQSLDDLEKQLIKNGHSPSSAFYYARRIVEGDSMADFTWVPVAADLDVMLADARYQKIHDIVLMVQKKISDASEHFTARLDRIVLHRIFALPIFFGLMYLMFLFAMHIGGALQEFVDIGTEKVFVDGSAWLLQQIHAPNWLIALIANGAGKGINTTLTFIPVIAGMFFFLSLLETSGYMARAAFVVDRAMRAMGLPGKSFVPMIVGFGCNVPAIMAARTLDSERDRLLTVMMSPFMSCSARLAIYSVFVAAFFPTNGQNIVFLLYVFGILMAVFTGFLLRRSLLQGHASPLILELPAYHRPTCKRLFKETLMRLRYFVFRAGKMIIPVCVILGGLNAITIDGGIISGEASTQSLLSLFGQWVTPLFAPMGIHQDNWPATVGLLTGTLAKEVVVGTLNSIYSQIGQFSEAATQSVYGMMAQRFDGGVGAFAYLLFILLYVPCISTMAAIRQEASRKLMWISIAWSIIVAYAAAVLFYQTARFMDHPAESALWIMIMCGLLSIPVGVFWFIGKKPGRGHALTNP